MNRAEPLHLPAQIALAALLRFLESCNGTGVALLAVWLWPGSGRPSVGDA